MVVGSDSYYLRNDPQVTFFLLLIISAQYVREQTAQLVILICKCNE